MARRIRTCLWMISVVYICLCLVDGHLSHQGSRPRHTQRNERPSSRQKPPHLHRSHSTKLLSPEIRRLFYKNETQDLPNDRTRKKDPFTDPLSAMSSKSTEVFTSKKRLMKPTVPYFSSSTIRISIKESGTTKIASTGDQQALLSTSTSTATSENMSTDQHTTSKESPLSNTHATTLGPQSVSSPSHSTVVNSQGYLTSVTNNGQTDRVTQNGTNLQTSTSGMTTPTSKTSSSQKTAESVEKLTVVTETVATYTPSPDTPVSSSVVTTKVQNANLTPSTRRVPTINFVTAFPSTNNTSVAAKHTISEGSIHISTSPTNAVSGAETKMASTQTTETSTTSTSHPRTHTLNTGNTIITESLPSIAVSTKNASPRGTTGKTPEIPAPTENSVTDGTRVTSPSRPPDRPGTSTLPTETATAQTVTQWSVSDNPSNPAAPSTLLPSSPKAPSSLLPFSPAAPSTQMSGGRCGAKCSRETTTTTPQTQNRVSSKTISAPATEQTSVPTSPTHQATSVTSCIFCKTPTPLPTKVPNLMASTLPPAPKVSTNQPQQKQNSESQASSMLNSFNPFFPGGPGSFNPISPAAGLSPFSFAGGGGSFSPFMSQMGSNSPSAGGLPSLPNAFLNPGNMQQGQQFPLNMAAVFANNNNQPSVQLQNTDTSSISSSHAKGNPPLDPSANPAFSPAPPSFLSGARGSRLNPGSDGGSGVSAGGWDDARFPPWRYAGGREQGTVGASSGRNQGWTSFFGSGGNSQQMSLAGLNPLNAFSMAASGQMPFLPVAQTDASSAGGPSFFGRKRRRRRRQTSGSSNAGTWGLTGPLTQFTDFTGFISAPGDSNMNQGFGGCCPVPGGSQNTVSRQSSGTFVAAQTSEVNGFRPGSSGSGTQDSSFNAYQAWIQSVGFQSGAGAFGFGQSQTGGSSPSQNGGSSWYGGTAVNTPDSSFAPNSETADAFTWTGEWVDGRDTGLKLGSSWDGTWKESFPGVNEVNATGVSTTIKERELSFTGTDVNNGAAVLTSIFTTATLLYYSIIFRLAFYTGTGEI